MSEATLKTAILRIRRGLLNEVARYHDYNVPYEEGMSVLDALRGSAPIGTARSPSATAASTPTPVRPAWR